MSSCSSSSSSFGDEPDSKRRKLTDLNNLPFEGSFDSVPPYWTNISEESQNLKDKIMSVLIKDGFKDIDEFDISIDVNANANQFMMYCLQKQIFEKELGANKVNEKWLYHGTNLKNVKPILTNKFTREYNKEKRSLYGKGTYFSTNPNESLKYSSGQDKVLLLTRVLLGESCLGTKDKNSPDFKSGSHKMYESMVNKIQNPSIFVLSSGSDHQCYVEFIIKLKCKNVLLSERQRSIELHLQLLQHAHQCTNPTCPSSNCRKMKELLEHQKNCQSGFNYCIRCRRLKSLIDFHSQRCYNRNCTIPNCVNNKSLSQTQLQLPNTPPPLQSSLQNQYQNVTQQLRLSQQENVRLQQQLEQQKRKAESNLDILRQQQLELANGLEKLSKQQKLTTEKINGFSSQAQEDIEIGEEKHILDNEKELNEDSDPDEDFYIPQDDYQKSKLVIKLPGQKRLVKV